MEIDGDGGGGGEPEDSGRSELVNLLEAIRTSEVRRLSQSNASLSSTVHFHAASRVLVGSRACGHARIGMRASEYGIRLDC